MNTLIKLFIVLFFVSGTMSCNYLDLEPERQGSLDEAFANQINAEGFLYSCYSFMPKSSDFNGEPQYIGASDEVALTSQWATTWHYSKAINLGMQTAGDPLFNYWSYFKSKTQPSRCQAYNLYGAIRQCYTFLGRVANVPNIESDNVTKWSGEAKFLIAYYHYCLLRLYGPIVLIDREIPLDAPNEIAYPKRQPYDVCVDWIESRFNEAIAQLPLTPEKFGKPSQAAAKALTARMRLYAASPLYNGNAEYYSKFTNNDGEPLINLTYDKGKWKKAMDVCEEAINLAHQAGFSPYYYPFTPGNATSVEKAYYDHRYMVITMPTNGNNEFIWAYTGDRTNMQQMCAVRGLSRGSTSVPYGGISPSMQMIETFYSKNGLPIDKDPAYQYGRRYNVTNDPTTKEKTVRLHLDREPRFYANIAYDRSSNYETNGRDGLKNKGYTLYFRMGEINPETRLVNGNDPLKDNITVNGYVIKKILHPESKFENNSISLKSTAMPLIRLTELYLNYAEAYYEYWGRLDGQALIYFNEIRQRAGIPDVDEAWQGVAGKDYREIIRQERTIELMFEGHRFFDARRWKTAHLTFTKVQKRWNCFAAGYNENNVQSAEDYLTLRDSNEPTKVFNIPQHYLYPLDIEDIAINPNLVQNPGW